MGGSLLPFLLVLILGLTIFFPGLGAYPLLDPDEGRNAEVAREIVVEGHWLPPTLNGQVRYEKPPLYYWLVACSFMVWGIGSFSARLPSALAALLGIMVTITLGKRLWGEEQGFWAGLFLATSVIYALYAHVVIFDMVLTLFITLAIALFWLGLVQYQKGLFLLSAFFAALAFLTKGPVGVLIPAMALLPPTIYHIKKEEWPPIPWLAMLGIFLVVSAPVFILAEIKFPGYCYKFFWEENVLRYLTPRYHREGPFFYYLIVILVGLLPWTWLLKRLPQAWRELYSTHIKELILLGSWIILPTLFFTFSHSKLPHYILPTFPAWALLLAGTITTDPFRKISLPLVGVIPLVYLSGFLVVGPLLAQYQSTYPLLEKTQLRTETPVIAYRAFWYSMAFYTGKKIEAIEKKSQLRQAMTTRDTLYILTKKNRFHHVLALARKLNKRVQVISESSRHILVLITNPTSPPSDLEVCH